MYECESWTIKKTERQRIDAFELWCWRRLLRVAWTAKRFHQSILKEIFPDIHWKDWCWSWNTNTLTTWCEEPAHWKRPWWERLKVGGEGYDRGWDVWMASPTWWTWVWVSSGSWWWTWNPGVLQSVGLQRVGHDWTIELNWMIHKLNKQKWTPRNCTIGSYRYKGKEWIVSKQGHLPLGDERNYQMDYLTSASTSLGNSWLTG